MSISNVNGYPVITSVSGMVALSKKGSHADGQARKYYLEAFISGMAHAHNTGDSRIITQLYDNVSKSSSYKGKIKRWLEAYTPLAYDNTSKTFKIKTDKVSGEKMVWREKQIRYSHSNPFWTSLDKEEKTFDSSKELKSLLKRLEKMEKDFLDHGADVTGIRAMIDTLS